MIGFFIKKNFFDGWDNFLSLAVINISCMLILFLTFMTLNLVSPVPALFFIILFIFLLLMGIVCQAVSSLTARTAGYKSFSFKDIGDEIKKTWKHGSLFAALETLCWVIAAVSLPYYFSFKNFLGLFLGLCVLWIFLIVQLSLLWFFPLRSQLKQDFCKCIKKCFILFFDNTGFTLFMVLYTFILIALTVPLAFLAPNISGILLAWNNAFRLRMYKYDWIEQHPEIPIQIARKQIPWEELLEKDRETTGSRTIRNLIFPWKD